jgi:endonuclease YncB( thermonuclease family)
MSNIPNNQNISNLSNLSNNTPEILSKLKEKTLNTPLLTLEGYFSVAKVVSVYDGDTCRVVIPFKGEYYKWNVRLDGYDTPEMRPSRSKPNRDAEIAAAKAAKKYLISLVMENPTQIVYIKCKDFDKYGRLLASIYIHPEDSVSVNELMVQKGHGYNYDGGTKRVF